MEFIKMSKRLHLEQLILVHDHTIPMKIVGSPRLENRNGNWAGNRERQRGLRNSLKTISAEPRRNFKKGEQKNSKNNFFSVIEKMFK